MRTAAVSDSEIRTREATGSGSGSPSTSASASQNPPRLGARSVAERDALGAEDEARVDGPSARPGGLGAVGYRGGFWEAEAEVQGLPLPLAVASRVRISESETADVRIVGGCALPG